jgi:beta-glucanase (GH16 family)
MSVPMNWGLVRQSRFFLAIAVLFLAGVGQAQIAQGGCTGVSNDPQGTVTWAPQWCQEFNATTAGSPDTTVWSFDLGNGGFGNNELETYCGPPGYSGNPSNCPTTFSTAPSNAYVDGSGHLVVQAVNTPNAANLIPPPFFNPKNQIRLPVGMVGFLVTIVAVPVARRRGRDLFYVGMLVAALILLGAATWSCGGGGSSNIGPITPPNNGSTWFSARMKTEGLENFQYGRIEASIKLPDTTNQGLWPAFWSLGSNINTVNWPACGETDFMEVWSTQVNGGPGPGGNRTTIHTTATDGSGVQPNGAYTFPAGQANDTAFHTYGMIWSANMQQFYIDNPLQPYYIATPGDLSSGDTWPFNNQIFLLANIAVGGTLGGTPSSSTSNPAIMTLDYVRQYQPSATVPAPTLGTPTPASLSVTAGATTGNTSTVMPSLTAGTGYVYFSCSTNAPSASCTITTTDPLSKYVVGSSANPAESVTVAVTTAGTTPGSYTVTVYAFTESNVGNGSNSTADANVAIPLTVN